MEMILGEGQCARFLEKWTNIAPVVVQIAKKLTNTNRHVKSLLQQYSKTFLEDGDGTQKNDLYTNSEILIKLFTLYIFL